MLVPFAPQYVRGCPIISPRRVAGTLDRRTWPADQLLAPVGYRSLRPALPLLHGGGHDFSAQIGGAQHRGNGRAGGAIRRARRPPHPPDRRRRSEEHTSELQSLMRISYAVFCLKKKKNTTKL